jgi:ribonuclease P protein component
MKGRMRIGFIVPKHKQSGVARNRLKRRLRELVRLHLLPAGLSADIVFRVQADAYLATFDALAGEIMQVLTSLLDWQKTAPRKPDAS